MKFIEKDTPGQRIADLCMDYGISQKELAEKIGLSVPQLSRIISGKTSTMNSDALIGIAEVFKVSTDYILGLSSISVRKSYDISQLGLSENAIKGLVTETIDVDRTRVHYYGAAQRRYYFFFEFTDVRGKTRKFQFEDPIHGHEVDVLKERIENAQS